MSQCRICLKLGRRGSRAAAMTLEDLHQSTVQTTRQVNIHRPISRPVVAHGTLFELPAALPPSCPESWPRPQLGVGQLIPPVH
eukprot:927580-Amphidinium_carterae.2